VWTPDPLAALPPFPFKEFRALLPLALAEDGVDDDSTAAPIFGMQHQSRFAFHARQVMTLSGLPALKDIFPEAEVDLLASDGDIVESGAALAIVHGQTRHLLARERTALNLLQYLSGIATVTAAYVKVISSTGVHILDTRKTTPGYRALAKYAVRCGGGVNHRMSLSDCALIKDNHIAAAGSLEAAIQAVKAEKRDDYYIVECDTLSQTEEALKLGAPHILLDNMPLENLHAAVQLTRKRAVLEASGGVTLKTVRAIAETGVDYISVGALTHSAPAVDIGLDEI
jgi:nicotinate-nucleotide pyrophosphorylase (carboxylating)